MRDYYSILKVPKTASIAEIKKAYQALSEKWHPKNNLNNCVVSNKMNKEITHAYKILSDEHSKQIYDDNMKSGSNNKLKRGSGFGELTCANKANNRFTDNRLALKNSNKRNAFPTDIFKTFSSEFRNMFKFSEDMLKISEAMFKMPIKAADPKNDGGEEKPKRYFKEIISETTVVNGKRKTIVRVNENGKETVTTYEDDVITSKTIDGVPQTIKKIE